MVGPDSAGADPGPACYRRGGPLTVTDANVCVGKIQPRHFPAIFGANGDAPLDADVVATKFAALAEEIAHATGQHRSPRQVAEGFAFPNGMAITPDNATLIIAESHGRKLTAFTIAADGTLSDRRIWADLGSGVPDGICIDAEGAVWYADVPNQCCVRVREGGQVLETVNLDRGGFACMLGGPDRKTLFIIATEWRGMQHIQEVAAARTGQVLTIDAPAPGDGWPFN